MVQVRTGPINLAKHQDVQSTPKIYLDPLISIMITVQVIIFFESSRIFILLL